MTLHVIVGGRLHQGEVAVKPNLTVGQALAALGVSVAALDRVSPQIAALAQSGQTIRVQQVRSRLVKKHVPVPAEPALLYRPTTTLPAGTKQQIQSPRQGQIEIVERIWTLDGQPARREFVSRTLVVKPQARIIALGARSNVLPSSIRPHPRYARAYVVSFRGGSPRDRGGALNGDLNTLRPLRCLDNVLTTGYAAGEAGGSPGSLTATGLHCNYGAIAVDPRVIPLGTPLYVEGYGYGFACDTGGAIKGRHIDLAFDSPRRAMAHGKQRRRVWILGR